jgi:hypothetical protein
VPVSASPSAASSSGATATPSSRTPTKTAAPGTALSSDGVITVKLSAGYRDATAAFAKFGSNGAQQLVLGVASTKAVAKFTSNLVVTSVSGEGLDVAQGVAEMRSQWEGQQVAVRDIAARTISGIRAPGITFDRTQGGVQIRQTQYLLVFEGAAYVFTLSSSVADAAAATRDLTTMLDSATLG